MMKKFIALAIACAALAVVLVPVGQTATPRQKGCLTTTGHAYEVCVAYVVNSAVFALMPYYEYGRSHNEARASLAKHHFESRYTGQARALFEQRVEGWRYGGKAEVHYNLQVKRVTSSLQTNTAQLVTLESWSVSIPITGGIFQAYAEIRYTHHVTMKRVSGLVLHKWVVTSIK